MADFIRLPTRSTGLKFLLVCALAALMGIPMLFVYGVQHDRLNRFEQVRDEVSRYEGGPQTVLGPVIFVPYEKQVVGTDSNNKQVASVFHGEAVVFAETGEADVQLKGEERKRAIYTIPVFHTQIGFKAHFDSAEAARALADLDATAHYDWSKARLALGVSSSVGILQDIKLTLPGGVARELKPIGSAAVSTDPGSTSSTSGTFSLVAAQIGDLLKAGQPFDVSAALDLSGAERFSIASFAKNTTARMSAQWPDPSFEGGFLPTQRTITKTGFTAQWNAPLARRGIPEVGDSFAILGQTSSQDFAVRLVQPTNIYTGMDRALKYSMMFIGLVFLAYFMFEVVSGLRAHPAQYLMVGLAQAIFFLLLLAFAERWGFDTAFLIAAAATIMLISLYVGVVFKQRKYTIAAFLVFVAVYAVMYVLMQAEDYALLVGAITSFAALAVLMYLTRNVAWYGAADARESGASSGG